MSTGNDTVSLSEKAYRQIEEMIVMRVFPPGSMISENQLSASLGCGRTPIREALQRLKLEGYIDIHPRRGALVMPVDIMKQLELLEVRRPMETLMSELACRRATTAERTEMKRLGEQIVAAAGSADKSEYFILNRAIHDIRIAEAHNSVLVQPMGAILGLSRRFWYAYIEDTNSFHEAALLHKAVLDSIAGGTPDLAAEATSRLLDSLEQLTQNAVNRKR